MTNIWTAASEGDLARVQELVESGLSPSDADENSYTPLHAAASWSHIEILRYLVSKGGEINKTDDDGETPLFVVETAEMARMVIELGGDPHIKNTEGLTASSSLQEDYPHIALYLRSITGEPNPTSNPTLSYSEALEEAPTIPSSLSDPTADLDAPTDSLLYRVKLIMEASERGELTSEQTDDKLREVVEEVVNGQVSRGREIGEEMEVEMDTNKTRAREDDTPETGGKRRRDEAGR